MDFLDKLVPETQNSSEVLFDDTAEQFVDHLDISTHLEELSSEVIEEDGHTEIEEDGLTEIEEQSETVGHEEEIDIQDDDHLSTKQSAEKQSHERLVRLPLSRIKTIMKTDPDVTMTGHEAAILIAKATELFVQELTKEVFSYTLQAKRKTVQRKDLELAIDKIDSLAFLEGTMEF